MFAGYANKDTELQLPVKEIHKRNKQRALLPCMLKAFRRSVFKDSGYVFFAYSYHPTKWKRL